MKILAIEFSSTVRSVALGEESGNGRAACILAESTALQADPAPGPFALIDDVLQKSKGERESIDCLVVGLGPGSYAGIRSAIAIAQGWQIARGVRVFGVSSANGLARRAQAGGIFGAVAVVIDAQRGEYYLADYEISAALVRETGRLRIVDRAGLAQVAEASTSVVGPDAAKNFRNGRELFPSAGTLLQLGLDRPEFCQAESLEPIYLRETNFVKIKN